MSFQKDPLHFLQDTNAQTATVQWKNDTSTPHAAVKGHKGQSASLESVRTSTEHAADVL